MNQKQLLTLRGSTRFMISFEAERGEEFLSSIRIGGGGIHHIL
jgi:hypothetical protein